MKGSADYTGRLEMMYRQCASSIRTAILSDASRNAGTQSASTHGPAATLSGADEDARNGRNSVAFAVNLTHRSADDIMQSPQEG